MAAAMCQLLLLLLLLWVCGGGAPRCIQECPGTPLAHPDPTLPLTPTAAARWRRAAP